MIRIHCGKLFALSCRWHRFDLLAILRYPSRTVPSSLYGIVQLIVLLGPFKLIGRSWRQKPNEWGEGMDSTTACRCSSAF